ncbi:MAG: hypothetical protein JWM10_3663 [Myxococcaceae bacterium]|nr:hypothetical protein [Myxococcaceae bacterium]
MTTARAGRWAVLALAALAGCDSAGSTGDAGAADRGAVDTGPRDTGEVDVGTIFIDVEIVNSDVKLGKDPDVPEAGAPDAGPRDAGPAPDSGVGAGETLFGYAAYFCHERDVAPAPGEDGNLVAIQLPPATAATELFRVVYRALDTTTGCRGGAAHQFVLFSSPAETPAATPQVLATLDIEAGAVTDGYRVIDRALPTPVAYNPGDRVFAAIRYGVANETVCIPLCTREASPTWWSGAAAPPYPWARLAGFDSTLAGHAALWVVGRPRP